MNTGGQAASGTRRVGWIVLTLAMWFASPAWAVNERGELERERRLAGDVVTEAASGAAGRAWRSTVRLRANGEYGALGTVVDAGRGLVVTKSSELTDGLGAPTELSVELFDGRQVAARVLARDVETDLALLGVEPGGAGLSEVRWADADSVLVGRFVVVAEPQVVGGAREWAARLGDALTPPVAGAQAADAEKHEPHVLVGVVSVPRRVLGGGVLGIVFAMNQDPSIPGVEIERVAQGSGAAAAGLEPGDSITRIDGATVDAPRDVFPLLTGKPAGLEVKVGFTRRGEAGEVAVVLGAKSEVFPEPEEPQIAPVDADDQKRRAMSMLVPVSKRRDGFTEVIEHHVPVLPMMCGGPVVDLDGRAIGVNIARVNRSETYALPGDVVEAAVRRMLGE